MLRSTFITAILGSAILLGSSHCPDALSRADQLADENLRDVFFESGEDARAPTVGRLGIALLHGESQELVGLGHAFRTNDKFRFDITSSQDGWLYIVHVSPDGERGLIWPRSGKPAQSVEAGVRYFVPPDPGNFRFAQTTGEEMFYVAIRQDPSAPRLGSISAPDTKSGALAGYDHDNTSGQQKIVNFRLRDPFGDNDIRTVVFDAGDSGEGDHYLYFSSVPDGKSSSATIVFRLQHEP